MFENNIIQIDQIPQYQEIEYTQLQSSYKKIVLVNTFITLIVGISVCCAFFFFIEEIEKIYAIVPIFILTIIVAVMPLLSYKKKKYAFRKHDVLFKKGLVFKTTHITPYIRLQHVVIKQGWYAKKLNLATLVMYTAANNFSDISIPGLMLEDAEKWRNYLMNRIQELNDESENQL